MNAETLRRLERVAEAGIGLVPAMAIPTHFIFERGGFAVFETLAGRLLRREFRPLREVRR